MVSSQFFISIGTSRSRPFSFELSRARRESKRGPRSNLIKSVRKWSYMKQAIANMMILEWYLMQSCRVYLTESWSAQSFSDNVRQKLANILFCSSRRPISCVVEYSSRRAKLKWTGCWVVKRFRPTYASQNTKTRFNCYFSKPLGNIYVFTQL